MIKSRAVAPLGFKLHVCGTESSTGAPWCLAAASAHADVCRGSGCKLLPTYGPGGDRRRGGGGRCRGGGEFLRPELVVADEAVGGQAEVGQELDQELVSVRQHRPVNRGSLTAARRHALSRQETHCDRITYAGGLSPQYLPILLASLISAPLKMETWS